MSRQFFVSSEATHDKMATGFYAGGWSAWLSQQNTFRAKSMIRAVGVLACKREVLLIEQEAYKVSAT